MIIDLLLHARTYIQLFFVLRFLLAGGIVYTKARSVSAGTFVYQHHLARKGKKNIWNIQTK